MDAEGRPTNSEAPPPSYNSIFGDLQAQKSQSAGITDYTQKATSMCCAKVGGVVSIIIGVICCIAFGLALPIAEIVIGSKYLHDCPAERFLPIYLIVMGVFSILSGCSGSGSKAANRGEDEGEGDKKSSVGSCCNGLIGTFLFAWFVCGTVWVFKMNECGPNVNLNGTTFGCFTQDPAYSHRSTYCADIVYQFVYYEIIVKWAICGVLLLFGCCCCCVMFCAYCCSSKE